MESDQKSIFVYYIVSSVLPNERAHGIQIVNTCGAIAAQPGVVLTLCSPTVSGVKNNIFSHYAIPENYRHRYLFSPIVPLPYLRFYTRLLSFAVCANVYLIGKIFTHFIKREKMCVYVRGESVLAVCWLHLFVTVIFESHQIRGFEWLYRQAITRVSGVVVITNRLKDLFMSRYGLKEQQVMVARDAVHYSKFADAVCSPDDALASKLQHKTVVVYCGSLGKEKGVYTLADASAQLATQDIVVVVAGGAGQPFEDFKQYTKSNPNIVLLGQIPHHEIPKVMACADMLIQPELSSDQYSNLYTSPMKLFEYMAAGKAIVAADVPSLREVLTESTAYFFESGNASSLAAAITFLYQHPHQRRQLGQDSQRAVTQYTWHNRGSLITTHIQHLVQKSI